MKKIILFVITLFTLFTITNNVKAGPIYNGAAGSGTSSGGSCGGIPDCIYNNDKYDVVRVHLVYYDGYKRIKIGRYVYFADKSHAYVSLIEKWVNNSDDKLFYDSRISGYPEKYNIDFLKEYFLGNENTSNDYVTQKVMDTFGVNPEQLSRESDEDIGFDHKGYRLIIEPFLSYIVSKNGSINFASVKDLMVHTGVGKDYVPKISNYLTVVKPDIGITPVYSPTSNKPAIADPNSGWGMNIINIGSKLDTKKCYKLTKKYKDKPLICANTNENNKATFIESYDIVDCDLATEDEKNATEAGRLVYESGQCKINCIEEVEASLPGHVMGAIKVGTHFTWPSLGTNINSIYQFNVTGTRKCKMTNCGDFTPTIDQIYNNFNADAVVKYGDKIYGGDTKIQLDVESESSNVVKNEDDTVTATRKVKLKIADETYRYIDPKTKKHITSTKKIPNAIDIGYGNLATSLTSTVGKKIDLRIVDLKLGVKNVFGSLANKTPYKCTYEMTNSGDNECVCPPGTYHEGKNLWNIIVQSGSGLSCIEAQMEYCDDSGITPPETGEVSLYCPEPNQHIQLDSCVYAGNTYQSCKDRLCNDPDGPNCPGGPNCPPGNKYECPSNTKHSHMDISGCVESYLKKGKPLDDAIEMCQKLLCKYDGIPIIYRPISLINPFPSRYMKGGIPSFNTDNISGRYPGYNWNSVKLVEKEILNNRNEKNYNVYNRTPLYIIDLDAASMRNIRDYNENQERFGGYSDFTLECKNGGKCLSNKFLRGTTKSSLVGGTCRPASFTEFENCINKN